MVYIEDHFQPIANPQPTPSTLCPDCAHICVARPSAHAPATQERRPSPLPSAAPLLPCEKAIGGRRDCAHLVAFLVYWRLVDVGAVTLRNLHATPARQPCVRPNPAIRAGPGRRRWVYSPLNGPPRGTTTLSLTYQEVANRQRRGFDDRIQVRDNAMLLRSGTRARFHAPAGTRVPAPARGKRPQIGWNAAARLGVQTGEP